MAHFGEAHVQIDAPNNAAAIASAPAKRHRLKVGAIDFARSTVLWAASWVALTLFGSTKRAFSIAVLMAGIRTALAATALTRNMINSDQFSKAQSLILAIRKVLKAEELRESKFSFVNILNVGGFPTERRAWRKQWNRDENVSTEDWRVVQQCYRSTALSFVS